MDQSSFGEVCSVLLPLADSPSRIVRDKALVAELRTTVKLIFDRAVASEPPGVKPLGPLAELLVDGLDAESIWEELQLRNRPLLKWARGTTAELSQRKCY